ncbi:MAG: ribosome silencing factor [Burkholderiaceae bacterium]
MTTESTAKKDIQKLQRAIVEGLEDVKAQDIQVFHTEHLSPLFERVVVASGTSNRQTKALAASVRDAVREAGFDKPRVEGEDNGEWIIVDCGAAVAHIMQPAIRQYYHLEEIWGEKPVRLRLGAPKPAASRAAASAAETREREARTRSAREKAQGPNLKRSSAAKVAERSAQRAAQAEAELAEKSSRSGRSAKAAKAAKATSASKAQAPAAAARPASKAAAKPAAKASAKAASGSPAKPSAGRSAAKPARRSSAKPAGRSATSAAAPRTRKPSGA